MATPSEPADTREPADARESADGQLAERLRDQYGEGVDPAITLTDRIAGPHESGRTKSGSSHALLARLAAQGLEAARYALRGELARGGMGAILEVWDRDLRRSLAMKVLIGAGRGGDQPSARETDPKTLGRFLEEAQVTGQLDHPGIVPVHELGLDAGGNVYFTMRLVRGRDLRQVFARVHAGQGDWNETRALGVLLKVCEAMAYAHAKGVLHRDLKPANVMVGRFGEVYVMDWGLARVLGTEDRHDIRLRPSGGAEPGLPQEPEPRAPHGAERDGEGPDGEESILYTMDGDVIGTPAFMPPEQALGRVNELDARADVYSVGAMLYHLLSRRVPFVEPDERVSQHTILARLLAGPPTPLFELNPDVPGELTAICEKAMARSPDARYASMEELAGDLRAFLEQRVVRAYETGALAELRKWIKRNRALAAVSGFAALLAFAGLAGVGYVQAAGRSAEERQRLIAEESAAEARRERENVLRLSALQRLEDARAETADLWPAAPERIQDYERWLDGAAELLAGLAPDPRTGAPGHYAQLAELRARALPQTQEERRRERLEDPRAPELAALRAELAALRVAAEVRAGEREPPEHTAAMEGAQPSVEALLARARPLVEPGRQSFGREAEGLALARRAVEIAGGDQVSAAFQTLAWGLLAFGLDDEALDAAQAAAVEASDTERAAAERFVVELETAVERARSEGPRELAELEARAVALEGALDARTTWRFERAEDRWWHAQLERLVAELEELADPERGLVSGISPRWGWGVERRLAFAREVEERTLDGPQARALWDAARAAIRDPARCPQYWGLELAPQLGLLPIGPDPRSGLWEFAQLQSGEVPQRDADGALRIDERSSVVLVLIPGGGFAMGAQREDASGSNYDPQAESTESPVHEVELAPFFLSKFEMTQAQWQRCTGGNPSFFAPDASYGGRAVTGLNPVESVSWLDCARVLGDLTLRLPTEAEWEYATRAGTRTPWWCGERVESLQGAANVLDAYALAQGVVWPGVEERLDDGHMVHAPVGSFRPNAFGLLDVHGNVMEWCRDWGGEYRLPVAAGDGERQVDDRHSRVYRGGSFNFPVAQSRSAERLYNSPEVTGWSLGVRPARSIDR